MRRIAEALGAWVPVTFVLVLIGFLGGRNYLYEWIDHPIAAKAPWLNEGRLFLMDFLILLLLAILSVAFLTHVAAPRAARRRRAQRPASPAACSSAGPPTGRAKPPSARSRSAKLRRMAPAICLLYAFGYSIIAFDQVMSLEPTWYSNLFGAFFAWGGFLSAVSATTLLSVLHRNYPGLEGEITRNACTTSER